MLGMKQQISLWGKLDPAYNITEEVTRWIDGRRVVCSTELMKLWGIESSTLRRYVKLGMPKHPCSIKDFAVFDLLQIAEWRDSNITNRGVRPKVMRENAGAEDGEYDPSGNGATVRKIIADADRAEELAIKAKLERQQLEGSLIESEALDVAQAELAVIYQTFYQNDKKVLPVQLQNKPAADIRLYLDGYYANRMADLDSLMGAVFPNCNETLYDVIALALEQMKNGVPPDMLTYSLKGMG